MDGDIWRVLPETKAILKNLIRLRAAGTRGVPSRDLYRGCGVRERGTPALGLMGLVPPLPAHSSCGLEQRSSPSPCPGGGCFYGAD